MAEIFHGLIQVAAAELKRSVGSLGAAGSLYDRGLSRLRGVPSPFLGVDVRRLAEDVEAWRAGTRDRPARISPALPEDGSQTDA